MATIDHGLDALVLVDESRGITVIPQLAELRRLNWFDGKLLRADDLRVEQDHMRGLVRRANRAGGHGVVHGYTCTLAGDGRLRVGPGLAIDPGGRSLLLPVDVALDVQDLIERTAGRARPDRPKALLAAARRRRLGGRAIRDGFADCVEPEIAGEVAVGGARWYVITVGWAEGLCGDEEVYGRLCEDACTTSTDRPWRIDGLVFRAHPLQPRTALATSTAVALTDVHERSLLASAVFADELAEAGSLVSGEGLRSSVWCAGAAPGDPRRDEVPIGVVARAGGTTRFLDIWIARRERIEPPPQRWWAGRLAMRPWDVFLAQVLQFQCQLTDLLLDRPSGGTSDPCAERQEALEEAFAELERRAAPEAEAGGEGEEDARISSLRERVVALRAAGLAARGEKRILIDGGIVELPPAGYLPVDPLGPPALEEQVRALMGAGADLTFCATRRDAVARAFEEAQHLDRISLLRGLDDPARREDVEIIVPDAVVEDAAAGGWEGAARIGGPKTGDEGSDPADELFGAGRVEQRETYALRWAGTSPEPERDGDEAGDGDEDSARRRRLFAYGELTADRDPFTLREGDRLPFAGAGDAVHEAGGRAESLRGTLRATFTVRSVEERAGTILVRGVIDGIAVGRRPESEMGDDSEQPEPIVADRWPAQLMRRRAPDGGTLAALRVQVDQGTTATATLRWQGDADRVELVLYTAEAQEGGEIRAATFADGQSIFGREQARLTLEHEPDAATPAHPAREASEDALRRIERAFADDGYAQDVGRRLFPQAAGDVRLRATRDWVLFRRRAVLRCGPVAPPQTRTETFAVYGFAGGAQRAVRMEMRERAPGSGFRYLGEVAFAEGSPRLARGADAVARTWDDTVGEGTIPGAGVVRGAPGGDQLGLRRIEALVDALAGVTPRGDDYEARVLEPEEVPVDKRGADGVLLVGFEPAKPPAAAFAAFVVGVDPGHSDRYRTAMGQGNHHEAMKIAFVEPRLLGPVSFAAGSAEFAKPDEAEEVRKRYETDMNAQSIQVVDVVTIEGESEAGDQPTREGRGQSVVELLGGSNDGVRAFEVEDSVFDDARQHGIDQRMLIMVAPLT